MPRSCSICAHPELATITKALAQGVSYRDISSRYKITAASVHRHAARCLRLVRRSEKSGASQTQAGNRDSSRFDSEGRCQSCGLSTTETDAASLMKRAERLLWIAETIAAQAKEADDSRLALQAVDRARAALETMMRATGLIGGDSMTVIVNAQQRAEMTYREALEIVVNQIDGEKRQVEALRIWTAFLEGHDYQLPALPATIENETTIRDAESEIAS